MRVILDTNVVLDVLLDRKPYVSAAVEIFSLVEKSHIEGFLCATTITTIDYLLKGSMPNAKACRALGRLLEIFEIAVVNRPVIEEAMRSKIKDFEDAVIEQAGCFVGAQAVITRNARDFKKSILKILDPAEFLAQYSI